MVVVFFGMVFLNLIFLICNLESSDDEMNFIFK